MKKSVEAILHQYIDTDSRSNNKTGLFIYCSTGWAENYHT